MIDKPRVRAAVLADAAAITQIYAHHVLHGTATYDTKPPPIGAMRDKVEHALANGWPFLVAEEGGKVVGYAYAMQFRDRAAYAYACENSIYIRADRLGRGIGRQLLTELIARAGAPGFRQMVAVIGGAEPASVALHAGLGFKEVGRLNAVGWKHGRWLDSLYMQRALGPGGTTNPSDE